MGKILQPLLVVAAIAVNIIPGIGQVLSAAIITSITTAGIGAAIGIAAGALGLGAKAPHISPAAADRLFATVDPTTPRKIIFGRTAMATDTRYQEWVAIGSEPQGTLSRVFFCASHKVDGIDEIWFDDRQAWTSGGGATAFYASPGPYLSITARSEGTAANTVAIGDGSKWGTSRRCTGLAYFVANFRAVSYDTKKKPMESPFASGIPNRITVRGRGAPVYDPRQDTSVGGSGSMRANDQTTWAWTGTGGEIGRNPALQILWYLLGWKINGVLACGRGIPPSRIVMSSFMAAANVCDETVTSTVNGSEPRYRSDGVFSEADSPSTVLDTLKAACGGDLRDFGGTLALYCRRNDLASVSVQLTDDDLMGPFIWKQTPDIEETFNEVRGRWTDPSNVSLYNLADYPSARLAPVDGIERADTFELPTVQSISQAQRLAKARLQRNLYRGVFSGDFTARAWAAGVGKIVELSLTTLGWSNKKFRVLEMGVRIDGVVPLVLQEESATVYAWDNSDTAPLTPFQPTAYDARYGPVPTFLGTLEAGATRNVWRGDWAAGVAYLAGDLVLYLGSVYAAVSDHTSVIGTPPPSAFFVKWFATGMTDGLSAQLTLPGITLPSSWDGIVQVADYGPAHGNWQVFAGSADVTAQFLPIVTDTGGNPGTLDVNYVGSAYAVTGSFDAPDDVADLTMKVQGTGSFAAVSFTRTFRLAKLRGPYPLDLTAPPQPSGLALTSNLTTLADGSQQAELVATWNASIATDLAYYILQTRQAGGNFIDSIVASTEFRRIVVAGLTYEARVKAVDHSDNVSPAFPTPPAVISYTVTGDTAAPAIPTAFSAAATFQNVFLAWTSPADNDLSAVEVWENSVNNSATATRIATVSAEPGKPGSYTRSIATGTTAFYWLKSVDTSGNVSAFTASATATTSTLDAGTQVLPGSITTALITVNTLNGDRILAGSIYANKLTVSGNSTQDALPTGITIGVSGTTIGAVDTRASDPVGRANTQTTKLAPGLVLISGATTLADWRNGTDNTKIEGGSVAANTIDANKLTIGLRGLVIAGLQFEHNNPALNRTAWSSGTISYVDDAGANQTVTITAGSTAAWTSGVIYIYWVKGATTLSTTTVLATANTASNVILAQYRGGLDLVANYGRTVIDGANVKTGTVTANQLATGYLEATWATISVLRTAAVGARLEIDTTQVRVYDAANVMRVRMGIW